jgi:hypothetical protein
VSLNILQASRNHQTDICSYTDLQYEENLRRGRVYFNCSDTDCLSGQIHDGKALFVCNLCGYRQCTAHKVPYHENQTCAEYDMTLVANPPQDAGNEAESRRIVEEISVTCPGPGCGFDIEKEEGCDKMECKHTRRTCDLLNVACTNDQVQVANVPTPFATPVEHHTTALMASTRLATPHMRPTVYTLLTACLLSRLSCETSLPSR